MTNRFITVKTESVTSFHNKVFNSQNLRLSMKHNGEYYAEIVSIFNRLPNINTKKQSIQAITTHPSYQIVRHTSFVKLSVLIKKIIQTHFYAFFGSSDKTTLQTYKTHRNFLPSRHNGQVVN
ncbi:hypothetical protein Tcan_00748, partial [Toxocara canis]